MIDAFHGTATRRVLRRMEAEGLVRAVLHPPETTPHWELTPAGRAAAGPQPGDDRGEPR
jgi:manganese/zinc/iron transport system permease protein